MPACVDFIRKRADWYPKSESRALVAGWGLKEVCSYLEMFFKISLNAFFFFKDFNSSDTLQSFDIPVVDFKSCEENAPLDFQAKVVEDKVSNFICRLFF